MSHTATRPLQQPHVLFEAGRNYAGWRSSEHDVPFTMRNSASLRRKLSQRILGWRHKHGPLTSSSFTHPLREVSTVSEDRETSWSHDRRADIRLQTLESRRCEDGISRGLHASLRRHVSNRNTVRSTTSQSPQETPQLSPTLLAFPRFMPPPGPRPSRPWRAPFIPGRDFEVTWLSDHGLKHSIPGERYDCHHPGVAARQVEHGTTTGQTEYSDTSSSYGESRRDTNVWDRVPEKSTPRWPSVGCSSGIRTRDSSSDQSVYSDGENPDTRGTKISVYDGSFRPSALLPPPDTSSLRTKPSAETAEARRWKVLRADTGTSRSSKQTSGKEDNRADAVSRKPLPDSIRLHRALAEWKLTHTRMRKEHILAPLQASDNTPSTRRKKALLEDEDKDNRVVPLEYGISDKEASESSRDKLGQSWDESQRRGVEISYAQPLQSSDEACHALRSLEDSRNSSQATLKRKCKPHPLKIIKGSNMEELTRAIHVGSLVPNNTGYAEFRSTTETSKALVVGESPDLVSPERTSSPATNDTEDAVSSSATSSWTAASVNDIPEVAAKTAYADVDVFLEQPHSPLPLHEQIQQWRAAHDLDTMEEIVQYVQEPTFFF